MFWGNGVGLAKTPQSNQQEIKMSKRRKRVYEIRIAL
jgi:hypothetical protein